MLCIGDSFTFELLPFYSRLFTRVRFVGRWGMEYDDEELNALLDQEQSHLVLEERTAWALLEVPEVEAIN